MRGDSLDYWHDDGFRILSPTPALVADADKKDDYNDASYVLTFGHAGRRVMLASDIEETAWFDMFRAGIDLRANVLIASHHGRKSGYCGEAMELIAPEAVIVSTAKLKAKDDAINDHKKHTEYVFSTRVDGDTQIRMWDDGDVDIYDAAGTLLVRFSDQS